MKRIADIAAQAADAIISRVEQTRPRALHRDMLIEEITRALEDMKMTPPIGNARAASVIEGRVRGRLADLLAEHGVRLIVLAV
ncbi:MAG TPA: hypothetical protein VE665_02255 [Hyphomicrobiaceae bacterium]|jgi:hypothetical protein|nr:hypothetical protein [Hyphomicrobiaceae bacterium]